MRSKRGDCVCGCLLVFCCFSSKNKGPVLMEDLPQEVQVVTLVKFHDSFLLLHKCNWKLLFSFIKKKWFAVALVSDLISCFGHAY